MGLSRQHAIVIGASIGGLCAAGALSQSFERVTVIDRDELPTEPVARRGVPQSRQLHFLLARGREVFDELFPGMSDELIGAGAVATDMQATVNWNFAGHRLRRAESGLIGIGVSRPLLEFTVRARVMQLPTVTLVERCDVTDLLADPDLRRVTGVRSRSHADGNAESALEADLVVDASGRGTRGATWLEAVCLSTCGGEDVPAREEAMAEFVESIGGHDIAEVIRTARPLTEPVLMRFPESIRRRYEQLDRLPEGYLVVGDALCSFNPLYGQGMTVAALEALLLIRLLREQADGLADRFFSAAAELLDTPWNLTAAGDMQFAHVEGEPSVEVLEMEEYLQRYRKAAANDAVLAGALLRVFNLLDEPSRLSEPDLKARVLRATGPASAPAP